MMLGKLDFPCRKIKIKSWFLPYTKINSKLIKELNIRPESLKLPEENIRKEYRSKGKNFLKQTPVARK